MDSNPDMLIQSPLVASKSNKHQHWSGYNAIVVMPFNAFAHVFPVVLSRVPKSAPIEGSGPVQSCLPPLRKLSMRDRLASFQEFN